MHFIIFLSFSLTYSNCNSDLLINCIGKNTLFKSYSLFEDYVMAVISTESLKMKIEQLYINKNGQKIRVCLRFLRKM